MNSKLSRVPIEYPVYFPFGENNTGWTSPQYGGGGVTIINPHVIQPTIDESLFPIDENTMDNIKPVKPKNPILPIILNNEGLPVVPANVPQTLTDKASSLLEQGKDFVKENPLLSVGIALGVGFALFGNKGNKK